MSLSVLFREAVFEVFVLEPLGLALLRGFEGGDMSGSDGMRRGMSVALIVDDDLLQPAVVGLTDHVHMSHERNF